MTDTPTRRYLVVTQQIVGNPESWSTDYSSDLETFADRQAAIDHGVEVLGHDDFNIATVDAAGKLVAFGFDHHDWDNHPDNYDAAEIARQLRLPESLTRPTDTSTTPPADPTERVDLARIRAKVNAARMAAILDEEEVVLAVTRDGVPGVLALVEQREAHAKRLGAAGVCGAIANLLRDTKPTAREYDGIRVAYGVALDAAGLAGQPPASPTPVDGSPPPALGVRHNRSGTVTA